MVSRRHSLLLLLSITILLLFTRTDIPLSPSSLVFSRSQEVNNYASRRPTHMQRPDTSPSSFKTSSSSHIFSRFIYIILTLRLKSRNGRWPLAFGTNGNIRETKPNTDQPSCAGNTRRWNGLCATFRRYFGQGSNHWSIIDAVMGCEYL